MANLNLKINIVDLRKVKLFTFPETLPIEDVCKEIKQKITGEELDTNDFSLFSKQLSRWLLPNKCLGFYNITSGSELEFKSKFRILRVRCMDDAVKTMHIDESLPVQPLVLSICKKLGITNPEEYSFALDDIKNSKKNYHPSEDPVIYLNVTKSLPEQGVPENATLLLWKAFHISDSNIDCDDPIQLNVLYIQAKNAVVSGRYPCGLEELIEFAAIQSQITHGNFEEVKMKVGLLNLKEYLPEGYRKSKDIEKKIFQAQKKLESISDISLKFRYVKLCRSLKSYGVTFFVAKEQRTKSSKLNDVLLGISKDTIYRFDSETKEILQTWPITNLRRWVASPHTFTLDFGEYNQSLYSLQTTRGEQISFIIAGYIDILMKRKLALEKMSNQSNVEQVKDTATISAASQGFTLEPASTTIPIQETAVTHLGNMAITSGPQTFYSKPQSERKNIPRPKSNNPVEHLNYQLFRAEGPLDALAGLSQPLSPDSPIPDQETKACSNHSLVALFSSFLASIVVLSDSAIKNDAEGILKELRALVHLLGPLADACSKFPEPATKAAASRLAVVTKELFMAIEQTIRTQENKEVLLDKVQEVTRVVHLLLCSLPSFTMPEDQIHALKINSGFLVAGNQDFVKHSNQLAANTPSQSTAAEFNKLIKLHSDYTQHLETIFNTVSHLLTTPHCSHQCKLAIKDLETSHLGISKFSDGVNSEESDTVRSIAASLSNAYLMFFDQMNAGNFKKDIEIQLLVQKMEKEGQLVQTSVNAEASVLITNTKKLTKSSADLVALLKRRINTSQNEESVSKFKEIKSSLTECTTKMVECTKLVAANPKVDEFSSKLHFAVDQLIKVANSLITQEVIKPSEYVDVPLKNMSITTTLLANHLVTSQVPQTIEAVYQVKDCNKRYVTEYSTSAEEKRIVLANDMAISARTLLLACSEDTTIEAPSELEDDIKHCKETLGQLESGLEKYSNSADIFELNSMAEEVKELKEKYQNVEASQALSIEKLDAYQSQLMEFRNLLDQIQNFLKVKPKDTGYSGIMKQILDSLHPLAQSDIQNREQVNELLTKAYFIMKLSSEIEDNPEKIEELNIAISQLQTANSSLIDSTEKLRKINQPVHTREAIIESVVDVKSAISCLSHAQHKHKGFEKQMAEFEMAFEKLNTVSHNIFSTKSLDPEKRDRIKKVIQDIKDKKDTLMTKLNSSEIPEDQINFLDSTLNDLSAALNDFLKECTEADLGLVPMDLQVAERLSDAQTMVNLDSNDIESDPLTYADASERITGTAAVISELIKQRVDEEVDLGSSSSSFEISKKLNYLIKAGVEVSESMALVDSKRTSQKCKEVFSCLRMIENANSKAMSIQSASHLGHASSSLCIDLKTHVESANLSNADAEKLNKLSIEIASKTKDILLATKNMKENSTPESLNELSHELREKLQELLSYIHGSSLPIRENLKEVSNACKNFVLCRDRERLAIHATRIDLSINHLLKALQRATPGQQEISAAMDQILIGIAQVDDALLKCSIKEGLQIKLDHQPQLQNDVLNLKETIQKYKEAQSPELVMQLASDYYQLSKLASDSAMYELIHKFGDSLIQMLSKKNDTDAVEDCDELLGLLELRKRLHQIISQPLDESVKNNSEYDFEHLCTASKSFFTSITRGEKNVEESFKIMCGAVKLSKLNTNSHKLHNCVDQALLRVAATGLLVLFKAEKHTSLSSPLSFLLASVKECNRASVQCDKVITEIEELGHSVNTWPTVPANAATPDSAVISKCGQLNECLNSIMNTVKANDEASFGDAVASASIVIKGLLEACSKSKNENMKENCHQFLGLWAPFLLLGKNTLFKSDSHRNWSELKTKFDIIQESIQNLHIQRLPDVFSTMTGHIQSVFKACNFHPTFKQFARDIEAEAMDLLLAAAACQKEISQAPAKEMYFDDGTWSEGLISAAEKVVENILILYSYFCDPQQSRILACGKSNQAAIKQLTSAASVRVDSKSPNLDTLHNRARKLHTTLEALVKSFPDEFKDSTKSVKNQNLNQIALIEAQAEVFEIEKELDKARERYTNLKKKRYTEPS